MKILAISWASCTSINREIFRSIAKENDVVVKVVIPKETNSSAMNLHCDSFDNENIDIVSLDITSSNPRFNRYLNINDVLNEFQPDIIYHEDDPISIQAIQYGIWCYFNKKNLVCRTTQNTPIEYGPEIKRLGMLKGIIYTTLKIGLYKTSSKFINHVFTINNDGLSIYKSLGFKNVSKIPLGMDEDIFKIDEISRNNIRNKLKVDGIVFSYIGRMIEGKGIHVLLEALSNIKHYKWTLMLDNFERYTKNNYHHKIVKLIDKFKLEKRIVFFDANHREISKYMNASDVVIVPSITTSKFKEQYGRVAPESMACGCLVITSNSGALPELVGKYGWIFKEGNVDELSNLLIQSINLKEKDKDKIKNEASLYAHKYLGIEAQKKEMMSIFRSLNE